MFWICMFIFWMGFVYTLKAPAIVLGAGLLVSFLGGLLGWSANACKKNALLFLLLAFVQMCFKQPILVTHFSKTVYESEIGCDSTVITRADRDNALNPHEAFYDWLKRIGKIYPTPIVEEAYGNFLAKNHLADNKDSWDAFVLSYDNFEGHIQQTASFSIDFQRGLICRHMKYHGCTWDQLLADGKRNTERYLDNKWNK